MNQERQFMSGNDAIATAVALARPAVIASYPITPQTTIVERLAEWHAAGRLESEFLDVESEHSALSAVMGASALGVRTFTATSSQGLLYMAECLHYAAGGRFPIVLANANRSLALPWSIYGDQRDSLSLLDCGWIQLYAEDAQEALDLTLQAFRLAEHPDVLTPVMLNVDGFSVTHTFESVAVPGQRDVDAFLPPLRLPFRMNLTSPQSLGFSAGPRHNAAFVRARHEAQLRALGVLQQVDGEYSERFGRSWGGAIDGFFLDGAERILVTLGSISGLVRDVVQRLRNEGHPVGVLRLRMLRPFPVQALRVALSGAHAVGVLEKNVSVGFEGTVASQVRSALADAPGSPVVRSFVGGLGGRSIDVGDIERILS
ncbi:MAG: transketolase C-terminal domain-containing protein [Polyangiaceae bacterium]